MNRSIAPALAALLAALALAPHSDTSPAPAPGHRAPHGGVLLEVLPESAGAGATRLRLEATALLDLAFLRTELLLPDGGVLRGADLPRATEAAAGTRLLGSALVGRPGGRPVLAVARATFGLRQPDGSVELLAEEMPLELGGSVPMQGVRTVRSGAELTLDVHAKHAPTGGAR